MSFSDHKITQFTHKIADLPDQPNLPADELKARFDSSPEELRVAHNAVCDDADRLEARVSGIIAETFGDTIDKEMLSDELAAELDAKATQTALAEVSADVTAEAAARESGDSALQSQIDTQTQVLATKCRIYVGTYEGDDATSRTISLGFTPLALLLLEEGYETAQGHGGLVFPEQPLSSNYGYEFLKIVDNGFWVAYDHEHGCRSNTEGYTYFYLAVGV